MTRPNPIDFAWAGATVPPESTAPSEAMLSVVGNALPEAPYRFAVSSINDSGEAIAATGVSVLAIWNEYLRVPLVPADELGQLIDRGEVPYVFLEQATTYTGLLRELEVEVAAHCFRASPSGLGDAWVAWNCNPSLRPVVPTP